MNSINLKKNHVGYNSNIMNKTILTSVVAATTMALSIENEAEFGFGGYGGYGYDGTGIGL